MTLLTAGVEFKDAVMDRPASLDASLVPPAALRPLRLDAVHLQLASRLPVGPCHGTGTVGTTGMQTSAKVLAEEDTEGDAVRFRAAPPLSPQLRGAAQFGNVNYCVAASFDLSN